MINSLYILCITIWALSTATARLSPDPSPPTTTTTTLTVKDGTLFLSALSNPTISDIILSSNIILSSQTYNTNTLPIILTRNITISSSGLPQLAIPPFDLAGSATIDFGERTSPAIIIGPNTTFTLRGIITTGLPSLFDPSVLTTQAEYGYPRGFALWPVVTATSGATVVFENVRYEYPFRNCSSSSVESLVRNLQIVYGVDVKAITSPPPLGAWVEGRQPRQTAITLSHGSVMGEMLFVADGISWRCLNDPYYDPEAVESNNSSSGAVGPAGLPPASSSTEAALIAAEQQGSIHADDNSLSAGAWVAVAVSLSLVSALVLVAFVYKIKFQKTEHQRVIATRLHRQHQITQHGLDNINGTQGGTDGNIYINDVDAALANTLKTKSDIAFNRASIDQQKDSLHLNIRFGSLDGLELGSLVGRGAFARVYKGSWKGCLVAVKCIEWSYTINFSGVANNGTTSGCCGGGSTSGTTIARSGGTGSGGPMLGSRTNTATKPPLTVVTPKSKYAPGSEALLLTSLSHPHIVTVFRAATVALVEPPSPMASGASCGSGGGNNISDNNNNMSRKSKIESSEELRRADSTATSTAIDQAIDDAEAGSNMSVVDHLYPRKAGYFESWLVMDYCDAGNVETAIIKQKFHNENGKPKLPLIVGILTDTARAVAYLHKAGIVHGDLKPANIMLQSSGQRFPIAKVADFGLSSMLAQDVAYLQRSHSKGTVQYMSPELLKSGKVSKASDVYAFAITAWEMYMADFAFQEMTIGQVFYSVVTMGERPEISDNGGVVGIFKTIVNRCWDGDASKRPCFEDLYRDLDDLRRILVA